MYFNEDLLTDLRLNILDNYVTKFIITEAEYTHNGTKKKLNFNINNFSKFKNKIEYIVVDKEPPKIKQLNDKEYIRVKYMYMPGTTQIKERRIFISTPLKKSLIPPQRKVNDPLKEKFKVINNNIYNNNNIINNTVKSKNKDFSELVEKSLEPIASLFPKKLRPKTKSR